MTRAAPLVLAAAILALCAGARAQDAVAPTGLPPAGITPTSHAPLPASLSRYWIVPDSALSPVPGRRAGDSAAARFARGAKLVDAGDFAPGLDLVRGADLAFTPLADYSRYYVARALVGLHRFDEARAVLKSIDDEVEGYLAEAVPLLMAEAAQGGGDVEDAAAILETLSAAKTLASPEEVQLRLARALEAAGSRERALAAYNRVYYEFPLSTQAADAQDGIERLQTPARVPPDRFRLELARAERLFSGKRWAQARAAFVSLSRQADSESDRALVALRTAECDYYLGRYRASREALRPYLRAASLDAEAGFFHLAATRALGDVDTYLTLARGLVADHADSRWAEETLNHLASYYINQDDDEAADRVFRELARRFPKGRYTDRAAWKIGWWA
ncbi:MAG: tetratricopeptide repeat protein, partial [Acidobacteria bacterium]|nr:tetratricopeptide repeat protein [Acidobacteriota bacterium]